MTIAPRSLQLRLALALAGVFALAALALGAGVYLEARSAARSLDAWSLERRAKALARHLGRGPSGEARLALPPELERIVGDGAVAYALFDRRGRRIAARPPAFGRAAGELVAEPAREDRDEAFVRLEGPGLEESYSGLRIRLASPVGPVEVVTARRGGGEGFVHAVLGELVTDVAWLVPIFAVAVLGVAALTLRRGLRSVREVSDRAAEVGGANTQVRLPEGGLPSELRPLVDAVNRALDRLEATLEQQRRFTADAAHQLRTPLAVLTARLDGLAQGESASGLRADVERMNRLVEQLLAVARLESVALDVSGSVDLSAVAAETVAELAPLALREGREVALHGAEEPVRVRGHATALGDALRNLVENALAHSPAGARVDVEVEAEGALRIEDRGPGIPPELRERVFERFGRGAGRRGSGAGLGLAIVREIARAHGGRVEVADRAGGGSVFRLVVSAAPGSARGR